MAALCAERELKEIVSLLRKGRIPEATASIPKITPTLKNLTVGRPDDEMKNIAVCVRGVLDSFKRGDYVLMADLLEYEILPLVAAKKKKRDGEKK